MKSLRFTIATILLFLALYAKADDIITISGRVTDFNGNPIDSCIVELLYDDFSRARAVYSDSDGYYVMSGVEKGRYLALYALRIKEYPRKNMVPDEDKRLEFWAWNVIADRDLVINPRYHRLELYGTTAFMVEGAYPGIMIYFRPMSVGKLLEYPKDVWLYKKESEEVTDISVSPEYLDVEVFADEVPVKINSVQAVEEYVGRTGKPMTGYIVSIDLPARPVDKPYVVFRVAATNREHNERGENIFFYDIKDYVGKPQPKP